MIHRARGDHINLASQLPLQMFVKVEVRGKGRASGKFHSNIHVAIGCGLPAGDTAKNAKVLHRMLMQHQRNFFAYRIKRHNSMVTVPPVPVKKVESNLPIPKAANLSGDHETMYGA